MPRKAYKSPHAKISSVDGHVKDQNKAAHDPEFVEKLERGLLHAAGLAGVYYRGSWDNGQIIVDRSIAQSSSHETITPPDELRHWYSLGDDAAYLQHGRTASAAYRKIFEEHRGAFSANDRIIDLGCSSGRIIRWFAPEAKAGAEVWGIDIDATAIMWAQENLDPSLNFMTNTTAAHLPFKDESVTFIYGNSLFTHIGELADMWFMEISRLLDRQRGVAVFTLNDTSTVDFFREQYSDREIPWANPARAIKLIDELRAEGRSFEKLIFNSSPWQQSVWYNRDYITARLEKFFTVERKTRFSTYQTGYVLKPR